MLGNLLSFFDIKIDYELSTLQPGQSLTELTSKIALGVDKVLAESHFDLVFVHGDTTTSMAVSLAAFYRKVKVAHVEAGLRTYNLHAPWPEEMNRRFNSLIADYHFAPTETAKQNLLSEHIPASKISVTGNTVIDALLWVKEKIKTSNLQQEFDLKWPFSSEKFLLVTCHRRENHKDGIRRLCRALKRIVEQKDVKIVFPVHLNPEIRKVVHAELKSHPGIHLLEPLDYPEFVYFMSKSYLK